MTNESRTNNNNNNSIDGDLPPNIRGLDPINPKHYKVLDTYETLDLIKDRLSREAYLGYLEGNVIKYVMRWRHKNGLEDLRKAEQYLTWLIDETDEAPII